jgi:hypothetical protein
MVPVRVVVTDAEAAGDGCAELWLGGERMAATVRYDGRLHLRIDARADGEPWLIETTSLALALEAAEHRLAEN